MDFTRHLITNLEKADFECGASLRAPLLNFVVAGGGFAGVETIAAMNDFLREALRYFPHLREDMLRIILVSSGGSSYRNWGRNSAPTRSGNSESSRTILYIQ